MCEEQIAQTGLPAGLNTLKVIDCFTFKQPKHHLNTVPLKLLFLAEVTTEEKTLVWTNAILCTTKDHK